MKDDGPSWTGIAGMIVCGVACAMCVGGCLLLYAFAVFLTGR